jgi:hypothetical protein
LSESLSAVGSAFASMQFMRPADISRTRGALHLSCTQASVAEFARETLVPDEQRASRSAGRRQRRPGERGPCGAGRRPGVSLTASRSVPFGSFKGNVLQTKDYSLIEPHSEYKFYAPDLGLIEAIAINGGSEDIELSTLQHDQ